MASAASFGDEDPFTSDVFGDSLNGFDIWGDNGFGDFSGDDVDNFFGGDDVAGSKGDMSNREQSNASQELPDASSSAKKSQRRSIRRAEGDSSKKNSALRRRHSKSELTDENDAAAASGTADGKNSDDKKAVAQSRRPHSLRRRLSKPELLVDEHGADNGGGAGDGKESRRPVASELKRHSMRRRLSKVDLTEETANGESGDGKQSLRPGDLRRTHSLRRKLGKDESADDDKKEAGNEGEEGTDSSNSGRKDITSETSVSNHSTNRRARHVRRASGKMKAPSQRRSSVSTEQSLRSLMNVLGGSSADLALVDDDGDNQEDAQNAESKPSAGVIVSKSVRRRNDVRKSKSIRGLSRPQDPSADDKEDEPKEIASGSNEGSEPARGPPERTSSVRSRKNKQADPGEAVGVLPTPRNRPDFTRTQSMRTASMSRRAVAGRGMPRRSASFVVRRENSADASLEGGANPVSKLGATAASPQETGPAATVARPEPTRGVGRNVSSNSGRRRPPLRTESHSARGMQRVARSSSGDQMLQRAASSKFISGVEVEGI